MENSNRNDGRKAWGNILMRLCAAGMMISSVVKFLHPPKVVAFMGSLGYMDETYFLIAAMELVIGVLFWLPATRSTGLQLVSAYFGGAIAAHLAHHPEVPGGPFLTFMARHPYLGALDPGMFLALAWAGAWLPPPEARRRAKLSEQRSTKSPAPLLGDRALLQS